VEQTNPEASLQATLTERLKPGPELPAESDPKDWHPCGRADGIIFLGERARRIGGNEGEVLKEVLTESLERQAFRYLRTASVQYLEQYPGNRGLGRPILPAALVPSELQRLAQEQFRPIEHIFIADHPAGLSPARPEYTRCWRILKAEEGIWCAFFVG